MQKLLIVTRSCLDEKLFQVLWRQIIEALCLNNRRLSFIAANSGGEPLHSFLICGGIGKNITGASEGEHSVALELSPNLNTLAGAPGREAKDEQQPRNGVCASYSHSLDGIHITCVHASGQKPGGVAGWLSRLWDVIVVAGVE